MKNKETIIILVALFALSVTCSVIGYENHNYKNDKEKQTENVSENKTNENNEVVNDNTNNIIDNNISSNEEFDGEDNEENNKNDNAITYDKISEEDTSKFSNTAMLCVKKYYKNPKYNDESENEKEFLIAANETKANKYYYIYYPITNKDSCGYTVKEIKIKDSNNNFKLLKIDNPLDEDHSDRMPIGNDYVVYSDNGIIKIYNIVDGKSYSTDLSYKDYYVIDVVFDNKKPTNLNIEKYKDDFGEYEYKIHEINDSKYNYAYDKNNQGKNSAEGENVLLYFNINGKDITEEITNGWDTTINQDETKKYDDFIVIKYNVNDYIEGFVIKEFSIYDLEGNKIYSGDNFKNKKIKLGELKYESFNYDEANKKLIIKYNLRYNRIDNSLLDYLIAYGKDEGKDIGDLEMEVIEKFENTEKNCNILNKYKDEIAESTYEIEYLGNGKFSSEKLASSKTLFEWIKENEKYFKDEIEAFKACNIK